MPEEFNRFADELDRMVAGQPPAGDGDLAAFAREVQGLGAARIDDDQRDRIRRGLMHHANSASTPTTGGAGPLSQPTLTDPAMTNPWVRRTPAAATPTDWRRHMVKAQTAIAIMTAVALLIVGAAWYTNQQGGDGSNPITTRYAAAPTEEAAGPQNLSAQESISATTLEISEDEDAQWWIWPANEACDADAFARSESGEVDYPEREYLPLGTPDREDAEAAARLMRATQSCGLPYTVEIFLTGRAYEERIVEEDLSLVFTNEAQSIENGRAISEAFPIQDPRAFGRLATEEPIPATPSAMERWTGGPPATNPYAPFSAVAIPSHAVLLPDGRVAIPESLIAFEGVEDLSYRGDPTTWERHVTSLVVLSDASGQWLVDERLPFCVGDCDFFWSEQDAMAERLYTLATEEAGVDATEQAGDPQSLGMQESNGPATPEEQATPGGVPHQGALWTEPISPEECTPRDIRTDAERQDLATGSPQFPERLYGPFTTPPVRDAADAAMTLRQFEACRMSGSDADGYVSDRFVYERTNPSQQRSSAEDSAARAQALQEVSEAYQDVEPSDFIVVPDGPAGSPPVSTTIQETPGVFQPVHARQLADGRIALPPSQIAPEGMRLGNLPAYIGTVYIVSEDDGFWLVDELLPFCVGECADFWQQMGPMPGPDATPATTPVAS